MNKHLYYFLGVIGLSLAITQLTPLATIIGALMLIAWIYWTTEKLFASKE